MHKKNEIAQANHPSMRAKLVRDSFTMPQHDYDLIASLQERVRGVDREAKKSEFLRAGLQALDRLPDSDLAAALNTLTLVKPGRPKKKA
jgi:hypothetical protein